MYLKHTVAYIFPVRGEAGWYSAVQVTTSAMLRHSVRRSPMMARFVDLLPGVRSSRRDVVKATFSAGSFSENEIFPSMTLRCSEPGPMGAR